MKEFKLNTLLPFSLLCAAVMLCYQLIAREAGGVLRLVNELAEQEEALSDSTLLENEIAQALRENEYLVEIIDSLRAELISFDKQADIVRSLSTYAGKYNLRIEKLKPLPPLKHLQLEHVPVELAIKGEFGPLLSFIFTLETHARCYSLRSFSLRATRQGRSNLLADIKLDAVIE